ncbi:MAG TPA: PhzF family phenazine biosynthesis protein [Gemmatimonadales bacterium]|nr:PhzF family phenazine biosynthesis protein [Gemmatimonadales bacterium]
MSLRRAPQYHLTRLPMPNDLWLIDAFTDAVFAGNPAGVCFLTQPMSDVWMQGVAREMNQAETAFLIPRQDGFDLRWFTPNAEVDLCGHATLASAHYLWAKRRLKPTEVARFHTRSGLLTAKRKAKWIVLDFPATPPEPCEPPPYLLDAFRAGGSPAFKSLFDYMVVLDKPAKLREVEPDFRLLNAIETRGVILTAPSDEPGVDFLSRFFAPAVGVPEDPVTGSAHCTLAPYWTARLGRNPLVGRQVSSRGGLVQVEVEGNRVRLGGKAVTVVKGTLEV